MKPLVVIPARGGSKGIPRKNIKPFLGRPLLCYSIDVARLFAPDDHIILSTDDREIAMTARDAGLPVPYMRPDELATDTASSRDVLLHAMDWADSRGIDYDCVLLLQPTSPLRQPLDVERCLAAYTPQIDMVVSVTEASSNPYYNCFEADPATGYLRVSKGEGAYTRRQDCPQAWEFNGAVYVINPLSIRREPLGAFARRVPVEMPRQRSVDLDTPADWVVAETIAKMIASGEIC